MTAIALKIFLALLAVLALVFIAGVTGLLFVVWPTGLGDNSLNITPVSLASLRELRNEQKFVEDMPNHYPGTPNEAIRVIAQLAVDGLLDDLTAELLRNQRRSFVLAKMKAALTTFQPTDSEEREQLLRYFERILRATGIDNSGELFNVWRYGFPYGWIQRA
ncbi:DUF4844 domain-containing protein [Rhodoferax sp.]|uniref:DUF4844 domain-containing protein n=1 Tax=Rhodoferax sp. TaxID=50421 RepID=UPI0025D54100|nr:DUF4844 domain-containing protein [Rhodoferax sp.]